MDQLTAAHCRQFGKRVRAALNGHTVIEIDLSRTTSMDCAGLGSLIAIRNLICGRNGVVRLLNPTSRVQQLLERTRAGQIFEIVKTLT
jgi:anti-anti-sigma factor